MSNVAAIFNLKKLKGYADWNLLLFLLLFLNVKLVVKIAAILIIYLLQFNFKFGFKFKSSRLPLFYPLIIGVLFIGLIINQTYYISNYPMVVLTGIGLWLLCILAIHQVKLSVERNDIEALHRTILIFLLLNVIVSGLNLAFIVWKTGDINPYTYQGQYQKYFIGTGDYIRGLTFDTSTTNAVLNAFGVIYFLTRKNALMLLVCMAALLLTGSNFTNIALVVIFAALFLFNSSKDQKSLIVVCLAFLVVFMAKISPQNNKYADETIKNIITRNPIKKSAHKSIIAEIPIGQRADSLLSPDEKKEKIATLYLASIGKLMALKKPKATDSPLPKTILREDAGRIYIPKPDINTDPYQSRTTIAPEQMPLVHFINIHKTDLPISGQDHYNPALPGKAIAALQTVNFLKQHPAKILAGDGVGNFSSKLEFKASGLGINGGYPAKYAYINHDFKVNHLDLYLNFFSKREGYHSLANSPFSVYDQLLAEYGLSGVLVFIFGYLAFFGKHYKTLTYGLPILIFTIAILFIDYWFEQLSVLVFFELMLLLNIKETTVKQTIKHGL